MTDTWTTSVCRVTRARDIVRTVLLHDRRVDEVSLWCDSRTWQGVRIYVRSTSLANYFAKYFSQTIWTTMGGPINDLLICNRPRWMSIVYILVQFTWLWWWLPLRLSKRQSMSPQTVLLRTTLTRTITIYRIMIWLLGSNHLQYIYSYEITDPYLRCHTCQLIALLCLVAFRLNGLRLVQLGVC